MRRSLVPLVACLMHIGRHLLDLIAATLWHVIATLSWHSAACGNKGVLLVLHIIAVKAASLQVHWIRLTLSWLANHVHADMLALSVNIVLVS